MDVEFCMQDPTDPDTRYLYEAIIAAVADATSWRGMYAFATRGGVDQLIEDPIVLEFLRRGGEIDLVVGIDAVTNKQSLIRMQELEGRYRKFRARVFWNSTRCPKSLILVMQMAKILLSWGRATSLRVGSHIISRLTTYLAAIGAKNLISHRWINSWTGMPGTFGQSTRRPSIALR
jgi:hypothetical protein